MSISLEKGARVSLAKELNGGVALKSIKLGLGWDVGSSAIDLDASCALYDAGKNQVETIWFRRLVGGDGAVVHSGDNLTGVGDGDDEVISVNLERLPSTIQQIVFAVTSYNGQKFTDVENAFVRIVNDANGQELTRYTLGVKTPHTALIMARLYRHNGDWKFAPLGTPADGRTVSDLKSAIAALL